MLDVCVSIVNTKEKEEVRRSLASLYADSASSGLNFGVMIVDNASGDGVGELEKEFANLKVIFQKKNEGFGKSHNLAMKTSLARYYFILNPDTIFPIGGNFLRRMFDFMEANQKVGIAGPKTIYPDGSLQYTCHRFPDFFWPLYSRTGWGKSEGGRKIMANHLMKNFSHEKNLPVDWVIGSTMFVRGEALAKVGGFDERYWMYSEDCDWCRRMWESGWHVYYVHEAILIHAYRRASAEVSGAFSALVKNKYARAHVLSWFKYFWKWRGAVRYYR